MTTTYDIDAANQSLGRLASRIATVLRGKHTAAYDPSKPATIEVVVSNLDKIKFTGVKLKEKIYYRHSGYPGGLKARTLGELWAARPQFVLRHVVYRMLPKNRLRDRVIKNLKFK